MTMDYENETCGSCSLRKGSWMCDHPATEYSEDSPIMDSSPICEHFKPSLQCRQVRALEILAEFIEYAHSEGWG